MKTIQVFYWACHQFDNLPWEHKEELEYSIQERDSIIDIALELGYYVMLKQYEKEEQLVIYIDNKRFTQR